MRSAVLATALVALSLVAGCARDARPTETAAAGDTYEVVHQYGTTVVPAAAVDRTVVTFTAFLDSALAVGVTPLASPISFAGYPAYLPDATVASLGESDSDLDLERIGQQNPGLILVNVEADEPVEETQYAELSRIAPTIPIVTGRQDFEDVADQVGRALNRSDRMAEVKAAYHARAAEVKAALAGVPAAQQTVSQLRLREDHVRVMMERTNAGRVMDEAGLRFAPMIPGADLTESGGYYEVSLEVLPEAAGEHAFVYSTDEGVLEKTEALPVWQQLKAVQNGTVHNVDFEPWMRGQGYLAANAVLDDISRAYGV
jgi:iron complex transport system substrate-binding protein